MYMCLFRSLSGASRMKHQCHDGEWIQSSRYDVTPSIGYLHALCVDGRLDVTREASYPSPESSGRQKCDENSVPFFCTVITVKKVSIVVKDKTHHINHAEGNLMAGSSFLTSSPRHHAYEKARKRDAADGADWFWALRSCLMWGRPMRESETKIIFIRTGRIPKTRSLH